MRRASDGNEQAFEALVRRYEAPLFNFVRHFLRNATEAEDVFQETFVRVHRFRATFDRDARFRPWLYRIAANLCHDRRRWWRRRPSVSLDAATDGFALADSAMDGKPNPADYARESELKAALDAAIAELSLKHRAVFVMARFDGFSYDEIAVVLGIPVGTVKSRMNKAVGDLMEKLRGFLS